MRIAVSLDGTLSRESVNIRELMKQLLHDRNKVVVLTGSLFDKPTEAERTQQLEALGAKKGIHYTQLVRISGYSQDDIAHGKAKWCRDNAVDMVFEGDDKLIATINMVAPNTTTFLIRRFGKLLETQEQKQEEKVRV